MIHFQAIVLICFVQSLVAIPYCLLPWKEAYPSEDSPKTCNTASDCVGADSPTCIFSVRVFKRVCCQNIPPASDSYMEPPLCPNGFSTFGEPIQCQSKGHQCPRNAECMHSASFGNMTGIEICCAPTIRTNAPASARAFEAEGVVPYLVDKYPSPLSSGTSFSVVFDTITLTDGQRFVSNDTNRAKVIANTFKITYKYPRTKAVNTTINPGEEFLLIIIQPDADNRMKPLKRSVPAFVAELTLAPANWVSGVATIEFTQSTPSPIVTPSLTAPSAHPAQPFNRYVIMLFKKTAPQPKSPATIKEFSDSLPEPFKIPTGSVGLWNVKGYLEALARAKYIESTTPIAGLVYLIQSTPT